MLEGNMYFLAAKDKNITFQVSEGAAIRFGNMDIQELPNIVGFWIFKISILKKN